MTSPDRWYAEIEGRTAVIAGVADGTDLALEIPTCPGWTLRQLATHVGRAHRWAAEITGTRSAKFIEFRSVPDGRFPADAAGAPGWLTAGAGRLISALKAAGDDPVWAFGQLVPAGFWARRMAYETMVHAVDAQLAAGHSPALDPVLAADAIDEWLTVMSGLGDGGPDPRLAALPPGSSLQVRATDAGLAGTGGWLVRHDEAGVAAEPSPAAAADVTVTGPAGDLLLVLLRRIAPGAASVQVQGDERLLLQWLAGTPW